MNMCVCISLNYQIFSTNIMSDPLVSVMCIIVITVPDSHTEFYLIENFFYNENQ